MTPRPSVSVCMATYNGAPFVAEQLASILAELTPYDEVVVVDDGSRDETVAIVESFADPRVHVHASGRNDGVNAAFARALALARGEVLFMADQDDIWLPGRVALMLDALVASDAAVVSSNSAFVNNDRMPVAFPMPPIRAATSRRHARNVLDIFLGRAPYYGCAMALRRSFLPVVVPIPAYVESHDLWIAIAANVARSNVHVETATLLRRIHGNNASVVDRPLGQKLRSRIAFAISLAHLAVRVLLNAPARRLHRVETNS